METFADYFTPARIVALLCRYRVKIARRRHVFHQDLKISRNDEAKVRLHELKEEWREINEMMPPRRQWVKLSVEDRRRHANSSTLSVERLRRTISKVHIDVIGSIIEPPIWYVALQDFINDIQQSIDIESRYQIAKPQIIPEFKEKKEQNKIFRPLTNYCLFDSVILSLTAKYLTDIFDPFFIDESSFAFRSVKNLSKENIKSHHKAIQAIKEYRRENSDKEIWVAECDIKKFFDCVNHEVALTTFEKFKTKLEGKVDDRAEKIFTSYLNSYNFFESVYPLSSSQFFARYVQNDAYTNCRFEWPIDELANLYGSEFDIKSEKIGVPQGGAISCLIANMVMHFVDEAVLNNFESEIRYIRYCDDMLILANSRESCLGALKRYMIAIEEAKLLVHNPIDIETYNARFWEKSNKSKYPYLWSKPNIPRGVPWLAFVGYQIRHDGLIRIRPASINKEIQKQQKFTRRQINILHNKSKNGRRENVNYISKKSLRQQVYVFESHLMSMSIGRVTLKRITKPSFCWAIGFFEISDNPIALKQLKYLDRMRTKAILSFKRQLNALETKSYNPEMKLKKFRGAPYSYFGIVNRPPIKQIENIG